MSRFILHLVFIAMLSFVFCGQTPAADSPQEKPNIVYILADDMGWRDVGYHGSEKPQKSGNSQPAQLRSHGSVSIRTCRWRLAALRAIVSLCG